MWLLKRRRLTIRYSHQDEIHFVTQFGVDAHPGANHSALGKGLPLWGKGKSFFLVVVCGGGGVCGSSNCANPFFLNFTFCCCFVWFWSVCVPLNNGESFHLINLVFAVRCALHLATAVASSSFTVRHVGGGSSPVLSPIRRFSSSGSFVTNTHTLLLGQKTSFPF